jgi:hypothetical protein
VIVATSAHRLPVFRSNVNIVQPSASHLDHDEFLRVYLVLSYVGSQSTKETLAVCRIIRLTFTLHQRHQLSRSSFSVTPCATDNDADVSGTFMDKTSSPRCSRLGSACVLSTRLPQYHLCPVARSTKGALVNHHLQPFSPNPIYSHSVPSDPSFLAPLPLFFHATEIA